MWKHAIGYLVVVVIALWIGSRYGSSIPLIGKAAS